MRAICVPDRSCTQLFSICTQIVHATLRTSSHLSANHFKKISALHGDFKKYIEEELVRGDGFVIQSVVI